MSNHIEVSITGPVASVRLNRPDKLNGLNLPMLRELRKAAKSLRGDRTVRVVTISGSGDSFCAGLDFGQATKQPATALRLFTPNPLRGTNAFQEACWAWRRVPAPVIAAVHGHCFGAGLQLALAADFRFTTPDAQWSVLEGKWGLIPDMSGIRSLAELVGIDTAKRLTMTSEAISGARAAELGLASEATSDPAAASADLAERLLTRSPDALAAAKRLFDRSWTASPRSTFRRERRAQLRVLASPNTRKALTSGLKKQMPAYGPRSLWHR